MNLKTVHAACDAALNDYTAFAARQVERASSAYDKRLAQEALDSLYNIASQLGAVWYNLNSLNNEE